MTKILKHIFFFASLAVGYQATAQSTTSSPYSQFGLGLLNRSLLPENRALGGISAGLRKPAGYSIVNLANPASYSSIRITTFDIGVYGGGSTLDKGGASEKTFDASLNHLVFGIPVTKKSGLSFGLAPYSAKGYNVSSVETVGGAETRYISSSTGGISKGYIGYGTKVGSRLSVGANLSYLFGKLTESEAAEFTDITFINSKTQSNNSVSGLSFDYGAQYEAPVNKRVNIVIGYSGSSSSKINTSGDILSTRYYNDATGTNSVALDTSYIINSAKTKIQLPLQHTLGFTLQRNNHWLIGADVHMGQWSKYRVGGSNPGLQDSKGIAIGAQIIPDITSVGSYFKLVEYRLGFKYDQTYIKVGSSNVNQAALTFGLGLPLPANRSTFYKINLGAELGQRGSNGNGLVRERFASVFLSFTMNDQWFQKYKFD